MKALPMLLLLLATGCGSSLRHFAFDGAPGPVEPGGPDLFVQYHGVGAFSLHHGDVAVLTDPFWGHHPLLRVGFGHLTPRPDDIEPWLPPLDRVQAVLVGHGHYDHVIDLPYVADRLHPDARVFASATVAHTFAPLDLPVTFVPVDDDVATASHAGTWHEAAGGRVRILPILSGHPSQWLFFHLYRGALTEDRTRPPVRAGHFKEGTTLAFLVDFVTDGVITHRVYVQTSSTGLPAGAVPAEVLAERPVDVALVAMDVANAEARTGRSVLDLLQPHTVLFCHFEDFFRSRDKPIHETVKVDLPRTRRLLVDTPARVYRFPSWNAVFRFSPPGDR